MLVAAFFFAGSINTASAQRPLHKFYYYPSSNVYYSPGEQLYYYDNRGSWSGTAVLPSGFSITIGSPRVIVYHEGPEIWYDNSMHRQKYKQYRYKEYNYPRYKKHGRHHY